MISAIIGLILLVGGITLYRTFALYEEKKEFNVLRGRVPTFGEYDINILAITVDGEKANTIPEPNNYVVNVDCQNGSGYWDYDNWNAVITEINTQTKCNLHFETSTESNTWRTWIQKGEVTKYYTTLHNFLSDSEAVTQVFNSGEASTYLKENASIVDLIKEDSNYLPNALPEVGVNEDRRSELVNIILNSTGLTNKEKYDIKLPFYVFKDGNSFLTFKNFKTSTSAIYEESYGNSIYLQIKSSPKLCSVNSYISNEKIDHNNYKVESIRFKANVANNFTLGGIGSSYNMGSNDYETLVYGNTYAITPNFLVNNEWYSANIESISKNEYVCIKMGSCSSGSTVETSNITLYEWYMY